MLSNLISNPLFQDICRSVVILIVGIFAMRIIRRLLKTTLEKSSLEMGLARAAILSSVFSMWV